MSALWESPFFGVTLTILAYWAGCKIQKRTGLVICNGLVLAVMMIIAVLAVFDIPYAAYNAGGSLINLFLGPATVCLAVTIYAQIDLLKKNLLPILAGIHVELQLVIRHPLQLHFRSQWQTHVIHCKQCFQQNHIVPLADYFFL